MFSEKFSILTISGGFVVSEDARSDAILPTSVCFAIATTTPTARPVVTVEPACNIFFLSAIGSSKLSDIYEASFITSIDSPVNSDSSTDKSLVSISLISAGTFTPDSKNTISPTVNSSLSISIFFPSLKTLT